MDLIEITVGAISRAHGVRGEVSVVLRTDEPERRLAVGQVLRGDKGRGSFTVVGTREHQGRWLVTFAEIGDRTAAEAARGTELTVDVPADETPADDEEYYDRQLVGLTALVHGEPFGTVRAVMHLPAQDVLEIVTETGVRLVPFVSDLVPEVDLDHGRLVVNPVSGLLDDAETPDDPKSADRPKNAADGPKNAADGPKNAADGPENADDHEDVAEQQR